MQTPTIPGRVPTPLWQKLALSVGGVVFALLLLVGLLKLFPGLVHGAAPEQRKEAGLTMQASFHPEDGDLFAALPGRIHPPDENPVLASFTLSWDADSFRVPAHPAEHYPIAAFGDSFTEGTNVALPWPDKLAEALHVPVQNYGYRGYGPLETAATVNQFAGKDTRTWIIYAFFAGNDLGDANRSTLNEERSPFALLPYLAQQAAGQMATQSAADASAHYDFPMPVIIGGNYYEMVFLTYYLWRQLAPLEGFAASKTFDIFNDALEHIEHDTPDTCHAFIFIPTKEQLYYPYVYPSERQWIRQNAYRGILDNSGYLQVEPAPMTEDQEAAIIPHFSDQRDAVRTLVESKAGWHFIDLLPVFQQHVDAGELLYYPYDTHWNQAGHDLAAQVVAEAMQGVEGCTVG